MLALAIISTVILSIFILLIFGTSIIDYDDIPICFVIITLLGFVIMCIWILYAR